MPAAWAIVGGSLRNAIAPRIVMIGEPAVIVATTEMLPRRRASK